MFVVNDAQLLPDWAEFVSGIIDTPILTPNAARDGFIRNAAWRELREELGRLIIAHFEKLRDRDRKKLSYILKWHDLGIKAACYYHDEFFARFANLLEWRVNRGVAPASGEDLEDEQEFRDAGLAFHWRTLPEVLATIPETAGKPRQLLCFTTSASANQYFDMAIAKKVIVVDASYPYEDKLIAAYYGVI
jgi:molecular chaperone HtpG